MSDLSVRVYLLDQIGRVFFNFGSILVRVYLLDQIGRVCQLLLSIFVISGRFVNIWSLC